MIRLYRIVRNKLFYLKVLILNLEIPNLLCHYFFKKRSIFKILFLDLK